jgi:hypothetical protein
MSISISYSHNSVINSRHTYAFNVTKELFIDISIIAYGSLDQYKQVVSHVFTEIPKTMGSIKS